MDKSLFLIARIFLVLSFLGSSQVFAFTAQDCIQNGGTYECTSPKLSAWEEPGGTTSTACGSAEYTLPVSGAGATPDAAIDDYFNQLNAANAQFAILCNNPLIARNTWVRTTSCNNSPQFYTLLSPVGSFVSMLSSPCQAQYNGLTEPASAIQYVSCPSTYKVVGATNNSYLQPVAPYSCLAYFSPKNLGCPNCHNSVGDPINIGLGNLYEEEQDFLGAGPFPLEFARYYNSSGVKIVGTGLGYIWRSTFDRSVETNFGSIFTVAQVSRPDGKVYTYKVLSGGSVVPATPDITDQLEQILDGNGKNIGWRFTVTNTHQVENYSASGQLLSIADRFGNMQTLAYDASGSLSSVTDSSGRRLSFSVDANGRIVGLKTPNGDLISYSYNNAGDLASVTWPDAKTRSYTYGSAIGTTHFITSIQDENGKQYTTYTYDSSGKATSSQHSGGVDLTSISYGPAIVTDGLGATYRYTTQTIQGVAKTTGIVRACAGCTTSDSIVIGYDTNGNVVSYRDYTGNTTIYSYDTVRNLEISRTEAYGTAQARTINTQWNPTYSLPTKISEPKKITSYTYDSFGNLLTKTEQATTDATGAQGFSATASGFPRTWTYTYNSAGQMLSIDGPRTDVQDVTVYVYDSSNNLTSITNALGHVTTISNYDANGRPGKIIDPRGVVAILTYSARGWLIQRQVSSADGVEVYSYQYDGVGLLKKATFPDNSFLSYSYDDAHRLTDITDSVGNTIHYTIDNVGNKLSEKISDPNGMLTRQISRVYDSLNRLTQVTGGQQ